MKHLKKSFILSMLLTLIVGSSSLAQDIVNFNSKQSLRPLRQIGSLPVERERFDATIASPTVAQGLFIFDAKLRAEQARKEEAKLERAKEVAQDNEYTSTGNEKGIFLSNPLMLNGKPLEYGEFNLLSIGELTVIKGAAITGQTTQVPFYVYLRRNGNKVLIPGNENLIQTIKIEISEILKHAEPGDHLVIEAVNKEDGAVKRILKLLEPGC